MLPLVIHLYCAVSTQEVSDFSIISLGWTLYIYFDHSISYVYVNVKFNILAISCSMYIFSKKQIVTIYLLWFKFLFPLVSDFIQYPRQKNKKQQSNWFENFQTKEKFEPQGLPISNFTVNFFYCLFEIEYYYIFYFYQSNQDLSKTCCLQDLLSSTPIRNKNIFEKAEVNFF